jgi:hypothetical protein
MIARTHLLSVFAAGILLITACGESNRPPVASAHQPDASRPDDPPPELEQRMLARVHSMISDGTFNDALNPLISSQAHLEPTAIVVNAAVTPANPNGAMVTFQVPGKTIDGRAAQYVMLLDPGGSLRAPIEFQGVPQP